MQESKQNIQHDSALNAVCDSKLKNLLQASKTIAVLGLSPDSNKPSFKVAKFLQERSYKILPIYPKGGTILGVNAYTSLQEAFEAEERIDILNIFRKSEALFGIAQEVLMLKNPPQCVWVQLGLERAQAKEALEGAGIAYVENLCIKLEYERLF